MRPEICIKVKTTEAEHVKAARSQEDPKMGTSVADNLATSFFSQPNTIWMYGKGEEKVLSEEQPEKGL